LDGTIELIKNNPENLNSINKKTKKSTKYAVIVMREEHKREAQKFFSTPLIFSIQEAKGLEYENIILYDFVGCSSKEFQNIIDPLNSSDLQGDHRFSRGRDKTDKSLDVYKFYINGLYVAITRSQKNLYIIESNVKHGIWGLLELSQLHDGTSIQEEVSSINEWQKEAHKLELQGKLEQAERVKKDILHYENVPWGIIEGEALAALKEKALHPKKYDKKSKQLLYEYAIIYNERHLFSNLVESKFKRASTPENDLSYVDKKYFSNYQKGNHNGLVADINHYGLDYRNKFNLTPMMIACEHGDVDLVHKLKENGANLDLYDNYGRSPLNIALRKAFKDPKYASDILPQIYPFISTDAIILKVDNKLIQLHSRLMEFKFSGLFLISSIVPSKEDLQLTR